jgi:hypothetical protein
MGTCRACGGVLGRDCYNEADCLQISQSNEYNLQYEVDLLREYVSILEYTLTQKGIEIPMMNVVQTPLVLLPNQEPKYKWEFDNLPF